jgi:hypothetical protein
MVTGHHVICAEENHCEDGPLSLTSYVGMFDTLQGVVAVKAIIILSDGKGESKRACDSVGAMLREAGVIEL